MKISILIPCYNEEKTIQRCLNSCFFQTRKPDEIIVVNDGSTDGTLEILQRAATVIKLVQVKQNTGSKSRAQEIGMRHVTGDVVIMTDADTMLERTFVQRIEKNFQNPSVAAVAGYVKSLKKNWITACRELDYVIGQDVHKLAQANLRALIVIPGCAAAFRTKIFHDVISFDHDTVTEDLDFTYKLHKYGMNIAYDKHAIAYTSDPATLRGYISQMRRWVGGGWQNIAKHWRVVGEHPNHAFEIGIMYFEGLFFATLFFLLPLISIKFFLLFMVAYFILTFFIAVYASLRRRRFDLLEYAVWYPFVLILNSWIFLEQFVREIVFRQRNLVWLSAKKFENI